MARPRVRTTRGSRPVIAPRRSRAPKTYAPTLTPVRISELARLADVPAATIKHYLREGLLPGPAARTSRNMSYYDPQLAARVRTIKELQTRRFLPLRLINELLEPAPSAAVRADADTTLRRHLGELEPAILAGAAEAQAHRGRGAGAATAAELCASYAISAVELAELAAAGLSQPGADGRYRDADLELIEVIDETRHRGLGDLFPMAILAPYAEAVRALVRAELEMFRVRVLSGAALPPRPLDDVARDATRLGERLVVAMRAKLIIAELRALRGDASPPAVTATRRRSR